MTVENSANTQRKNWDSWAPLYDALNADKDPANEVAFLQKLCPNGRILELAVGSGRVALPLASAGRDVTGVDISPKMLEELHKKSGNAEIDIICDDMANVDAKGPYDLIYLIDSGLFNLTEPARQIDCFKNAARMLTPDGSFVIETICVLPNVLAQPKRISLHSILPNGIVLYAWIIDQQNQRFQLQNISLTTDGIQVHPMENRYCSVAELDQMAALAELELKDRFADFERNPFTATSPTQVSVYTKQG